MKPILFKTALFLVMIFAGIKTQAQTYVDVVIINNNNTAVCNSGLPSFLVTTTPGNIFGPYAAPSYVFPGGGSVTYACVNMGNLPTTINVYDGVSNFFFAPNTTGATCATAAIGFCNTASCVGLPSFSITSTLTGPTSPSLCSPPTGSLYTLTITIN